MSLGRLPCSRWSLVVALLSASLPLCHAESARELSIRSGTISIEHGVLVSAHNRLTGETYTVGQGSDHVAGILRTGSPSAWVEDGAGQPLPTATSDSVRAEVTWPDGSVLTTTATTSQDGTDFTVRQTVQSSAPGVGGCQWGITGLSDDKTSLIVPVWSGVQFGKGAPIHEGVFDWPGTWEAQMLIVQGPKGGMWIHADDPDDRFKGLWIRRRKGLFDLGFRTTNEGSPADHAAAESVTWRIGFYQGDWRVPAREFRDGMARTAGLTPVAQQQPAWVAGIRSVVILTTAAAPDVLDEARAVLTKLQNWVTPSKTLLYVPTWRRDGYDLNYPDYTAHEGFRDLVDFAHELGYRVMPHTCYYGVNLENPEYGNLQPYHMRDLLSGDLITYEWPFSDPVPHIAMIHPGAKSWREMYVRKCTEAVERYGVDAFHLDVTLVMPNVTQRADGLNTIQGNVAFHRDLRTGLPQIALGGEGLNEVSCRHEAFAQTHGLLAISMGSSTPERISNDAGIDCSHPISSFLLSPFTRWYGYLGYPTPDASPLYRGWTRAYESWGVTPTLSRPRLADLQSPGPDLRVRLEEMRLVDRYDLQPDFDAPLTPHTKCTWRGPSGARLVYERDEHGGTHAWFADASGARRTVYRYLRGSTVFSGEGNVGQSAAFDDEGLYGLDPNRTVLYTPEPHRSNAPHLLRLPAGLVARGLRSSPDMMLFDLAAPTRDLSLLRTFPAAHVGTTIAGQDLPLGNQALLTETPAVCGGKSMNAIFAHPPWDAQNGVVGSVFAEWTVTVPQAGSPSLEVSVGMRDGAEESDGVTFVVHVDGKRILQQEWKRCEWLPCRIDLSEFAGRAIKLRLAVGKGPEGRGAFAWAAWGNPIITSEPVLTPLTVEVLAPAKGLAVAGPSTPATSTFLGPEAGLYRHRIETHVPGATCLFFRKPEPSSLPLDLRTAPFTWTPTRGGTPIAVQDRPPYLTVNPGEGCAGGEDRPALVAHPPIGGAVAADYLVTLPPDRPARLSFAAAIEDGAKSTNGIAFIVTVNGQTVSRQDLSGPDGWHPATVDLGVHAGRTILLSLVADAMGDASCDWARWGTPLIEPADPLPGG